MNALLKVAAAVAISLSTVLILSHSASSGASAPPRTADPSDPQLRVKATVLDVDGSPYVGEVCVQLAQSAGHGHSLRALFKGQSSSDGTFDVTRFVPGMDPQFEFDIDVWLHQSGMPDSQSRASVFQDPLHGRAAFTESIAVQEAGGRHVVDLMRVRAALPPSIGTVTFSGGSGLLEVAVCPASLDAAQQFGRVDALQMPFGVTASLYSWSLANRWALKGTDSTGRIIGPMVFARGHDVDAVPHTLTTMHGEIDLLEYPASSIVAVFRADHYAQNSDIPGSDISATVRCGQRVIGTIWGKVGPLGDYSISHNFSGEYVVELWNHDALTDSGIPLAVQTLSITNGVDVLLNFGD